MKKSLICIPIAVMAQASLAVPLYTYTPPDADRNNLTAPVAVDGKCSKSSVSITRMVVSAGSREGTNVVGDGVSATDCLGYITSPDNDWGKDPSPNTGELYQGLLNGELSKAKGQSTTQYYVDPNTFLDNKNDRWLDEDRPGWIAVAGADCDDGDDGEVCATSNPNDANWYKSVGDINIGSFIDVTFGSGWWSLEITDIAALLAAEERFIGGSATYDHLTFVLKGANNKDAQGVSAPWAIFDFNFYDLIDDGVDVRFDEFYSFEGTWETDVIGGKALSHWSMWVHDPPLFTTTNVPAPAPLFLIIPVFALVMRRRKV